MGNIKEIKIKNRTYYFFNDMINITNFNPNLQKIDKKSYKNIDICYIGFITMKDSDHVKINSVNPLYLIIGEVDGYFEGKNGSKYLILDSTDKNKEVLKMYAELWYRIKNSIGCNSTECNSIEYNFVKFNSIECNSIEFNSIEKVNNKLSEYGKDL